MSRLQLVATAGNMIVDHIGNGTVAMSIRFGTADCTEVWHNPAVRSYSGRLRIYQPSSITR